MDAGASGGSTGAGGRGSGGTGVSVGIGGAGGAQPPPLTDFPVDPIFVDPSIPTSAPSAFSARRTPRGQRAVHHLAGDRRR